MTLFTFQVIRLFLASALSAVLAFFLVSPLIKLLYKKKFWKKRAREKTITGEKAEVFYSLHKNNETSVPRGGGVIIWLTTLIIISLFLALAFIDDPWWLKLFNFFSRRETWLPIFTLAVASLVGLADDILQVLGKGKYVGGGMTLTRRLIIVLLIGLIGGWWFYYKLDWDSIHIPLIFNFPEGIDIELGPWIILLFVVVMLACWAGGIVDGVDGLAGGIFAIIFTSFSIIAFVQGKADLATFCGVIVGSLFAFLWFNIPPAKFYMGETGILGLTSTMAVIAFLTDSVAVLPIIAGVVVIEVGSVILQLLSKKFLKRKIWLSTPIHHHFEAKGWPPYQVTMRFWILGMVLAIIGVAIRLLG